MSPRQDSSRFVNGDAVATNSVSACKQARRQNAPHAVLQQQKCSKHASARRSCLTTVRRNRYRYPRHPGAKGPAAPSHPDPSRKRHVMLWDVCFWITKLLSLDRFCGRRPTTCGSRERLKRIASRKFCLSLLAFGLWLLLDCFCVHTKGQSHNQVCTLVTAPGCILDNNTSGTCSEQPGQGSVHSVQCHDPSELLSPRMIVNIGPRVWMAGPQERRASATHRIERG